jgi:hypothetical protein
MLTELPRPMQHKYTQPQSHNKKRNSLKTDYEILHEKRHK